MKVNLNFELDYAEEEAYKTKIKEVLDKELESALHESIAKSLSMVYTNEQRIKDMIECILKETLGRKLEPFSEKLLKKIHDETELVNKYYVEQNERVLRGFAHLINFAQIIMISAQILNGGDF